MQDRYTGDIGDYVKLALLRALGSGRQLGVAWWRVPDEDHNADGKHLGYLDQPAQWRSLDQELFDGLRSIVQAGQRRVAAIESSPLLPGAAFANEMLRVRDVRPAERAQQRADWFGRVLRRLEDCDLVFVDPDNGLEPAGFKVRRQTSAKSVTFDELRQLRRPGRTLVVYHHQTRYKGGHLAELRHLLGKLRDDTDFEIAGALRARPGTGRAFLVLDAGAQERQRIERFAQDWHGHCAWHTPQSLGLASAA